MCQILLFVVSNNLQKYFTIYHIHSKLKRSPIRILFCYGAFQKQQKIKAANEDPVSWVVMVWVVIDMSCFCLSRYCWGIIDVSSYCWVVIDVNCYLWVVIAESLLGDTPCGACLQLRPRPTPVGKEVYRGIRGKLSE